MLPSWTIEQCSLHSHSNTSWKATPPQASGGAMPFTQRWRSRSTEPRETSNVPGL